MIHGRPYEWDVDVEEETLGLSSFYTIHLNLKWREGGRDMRLWRDSFSLKTRE
jgi:hypothetical protein